MSSEAVSKAVISDNQTKMSARRIPGEKFSPEEKCLTVEEVVPYTTVEEVKPYARDAKKFNKSKEEDAEIDTIERSPGDLKEKVERTWQATRRWLVATPLMLALC